MNRFQARSLFGPPASGTGPGDTLAWAGDGVDDSDDPLADMADADRADAQLLGLVLCAAAATLLLAAATSLGL